MGTVESIVGIVNYIEILQIEKKNNLGDIPRVLLQIEFVLFSIRMLCFIGTHTEKKHAQRQKTNIFHDGDLIRE